jgi:hypothetical protein
VRQSTSHVVQPSVIGFAMGGVPEVIAGRKEACLVP